MSKLGWLAIGILACKAKAKEVAPAQGAGSAEAAAVAPAPAPPPADVATRDVTHKLEALLPAIKKVAADPAVVQAVQAQNTRKLPLDAIMQLDKDWSAAPADAIQPYLDNPCSKALAKHRDDVPATVEAFAMDNQGALVCALAKTSDYWQGDEDKWQRAYAGGNGSDFIDKPKFDDSSQTYSVQISVPVSDGKRVIGALTIGLEMDKL